MGDTDYPEGDGRSDCEMCQGRGVIPIPPKKRPQKGVGEMTQPCPCVLFRDIQTNLDRGWEGLSGAAPISESPLRDEIDQNLWITGSLIRLREHIRHVAVRMGPRWYFQVVSDAVLMDAWLSRDIAEVWDPDVDAIRRTVSSKYAQLSDLVDPPKLLIIQLGVKAARNKAMPEVLLEALHRRYLMQDGKPTWLLDQPVYPLADGHISYSDRIAELLTTWKHVDLGDDLEQGDESQEGVHTIVMGQGDTGTWENQTGDMDLSASDKKKWRKPR